MKTGRKIILGVMTFICTVSIATFIWLLALQTTILNRNVVKEWLSTSDVYSHFVKDISQNLAPQSGDAVTSEIMTTALDNTFTPEYVQSQSEGIIDSFYDWMEGKTSHFIFTINLQDKNETLNQELSKALISKIEKLPECPNNQPVTDLTKCRPANLSTKEISEETSKQFISNIELFNQPFIGDSVIDIDSPQTGIDQIPTYRSWVDILIILLPVFSVLSITIILLITTNKLAEIKRLSRQICLGSATTLIVSLLLLYSANNLDILPDISGESNVLVVTFSSVIQKVLSGIATQIAIISGIVTGISATSWITTKIIQYKQNKNKSLQPPEQDLKQPTPPTAPDNKAPNSDQNNSNNSGSSQTSSK